MPKSRRLRASASSVDWLAFAGATRKPLDPLRHAEEPFAGANLGRWPEIWCRRLVTALEHSSEAVRFTSGMFCATNWSKLTSSIVPIATAVSTMTTPNARCSTGPRPAVRTRSNRRLPPSVSASSTSADPIA